MKIEPTVISHKCGDCGRPVKGNCSTSDNLVAYEVEVCLYCLREKLEEMIDTAYTERGKCADLGQIEEMKGIDQVIKIIRDVIEIPSSK